MILIGGQQVAHPTGLSHQKTMPKSLVIPQAERGLKDALCASLKMPLQAMHQILLSASLWWIACQIIATLLLAKEDES